MRNLTVGVIQTHCSDDLDDNVSRIEALVREAAGRGAQVILPQELFAGLYFCREQNAEHFRRAHEFDGHPMIAHFAKLAKELQLVLPVSFFERQNQAFFNSVAMIDADGQVLGCYRKSHIPGDPGYQEKFYFSPGNSGFKVWRTAYARIGVGICWDQWFPEAARCMALAGAELLLYPSAIGSEPQDSQLDSCEHWQTVMRGHAAANLMPLAAANRIGSERIADYAPQTYYGSSFITDGRGALVASAPRDHETVITASFDLDQLAQARASWGLFRDRRPDLYQRLARLDGG